MSVQKGVCKKGIYKLGGSLTNGATPSTLLYFWRVALCVNGVVMMFTMNSEYSIIHSVHLIVHSVYIESSFVML